MKLGLVSFLAALAAAPLAAQAAPSATRYSVTLQATVDEQTTYTQTITENEDCTSSKTGTDGRQLRVRTVRSARVSAIRGTVRVAVSGTDLGGKWSQLRRCRFEPPERLNGVCRATNVGRFVANVSFRRTAPNRVAVGAATDPRLSEEALCGLADRVQTGRWLELTVGKIAERRLRAGDPRVVATGTAQRERSIMTSGSQTLKVGQTIIVRWRLVFTRRA
ncbi:MAG TPA: hypothetical protein VIZ29_02565 [Gaiellaceae bacterium]